MSNVYDYKNEFDVKIKFKLKRLQTQLCVAMLATHQVSIHNLNHMFVSIATPITKHSTLNQILGFLFILKNIVKYLHV